MSAPASKAAPERRAPVVVAWPADPAEREEVEVSTLRTLLRLALDPAQHPWRAHWRLGKRNHLVTLFAAVALLLLFLASCTPLPPESIRQATTTPRASSGARCESLLVSRELQVPPSGEVADLRLTVEDIPPVLGKLRLLVRAPRFPARLELEGAQGPEFDRVLELQPGRGQRELTAVLSRPPNADSDWPREQCKACRVDVELSGLFGAREGADAFFKAALQEAAAVEDAFARQSEEPASRPSLALRELADKFAAEAKRCGVALEAPLNGVLAALERLDGARALFYASGPPAIPDAQGVQQALRAAAFALKQVPVLADAAVAAGWPTSLSVKSATRLRFTALHLDLFAQAAALPKDDRAIAARWIALALAPDAAALEKRAAQLPAIRDLEDAKARLAWVDPMAAALLPLPGLSHPAAISVREWRAVRRGQKCIGPGGAAPVNDAAAEARAVARMLGADDSHRFRISRATDLAAARERLSAGKGLLCEPPHIDLADAFADLSGGELGPAARRVERLLEAIRTDPSATELLSEAFARAGELFCRLLAPENIERRARTLEGYKLFVEGGTHLLELVPGPLRCNGERVTAREVRKRFRDAYRSALEQHGLADKLCVQRAGRCPEEIAGSVRKLFGLQAPELARPVEHGRALDFPPPFGFGDAWVAKIDRCAREACDVLGELSSRAPAGQFDGALCKPRGPDDARPQEVLIDKPESASSVSLASCDAHIGVRLTLRKTPAAGTLVAIASSHRFRYGSEVVSRQSRHPQLGRIFERVADLADPSDVARRPDGAFDVSLTPTVENQVFYFISLKRRDY